jgi:hypothetical protein
MFFASIHAVGSIRTGKGYGSRKRLPGGILEKRCATAT